MQRAHHFASGVKVGREVIHAEQCHRRQQANLSARRECERLPSFRRGDIFQAMKMNASNKIIESTIILCRP